MIYLASPYTHEDPFVREDRYLRAMQALSFLLRDGHVVYSPIVHCHEMAKILDIPKESDFWWNYNKGMIEASRGILILRLDGWEQSIGIKQEREYAESMGKEVGLL